MEKIKFILLALVAIFIIACEKVDDDNPLEGPKELTGSVDSALILEDVFEDPNVADYYVSATWLLNADVTIKPGVNIMMKSESIIRVNDSGSLNAVGTEFKPITFFGEQGNKGFWSDIDFDNSNSTKNKLHYVIISDGGGSYSYGIVTLSGNAQVAISQSIIQNSATYGIFVVNDPATLPGFNANIISDCADYPIHLHTSQLHYLDASSAFLNNRQNNYIEVSGSGLTQNVSWKKLTTSVFFNSPYNNIFGDLTIDAGASFIMGDGAKLLVEPEGSLKMIGTPVDRITFMGNAQSPGYHEGIVYEDSNNPLNEIQYVDISYGGGGYYNSNLALLGDTQIKVGNSSFNYSAMYGIYVSRYSTLNNLGGNVYMENSSDDIFVQNP